MVPKMFNNIGFYRNNEDLMSHDLIMSSIDDNEFSSLNSTINLSKDEDIISGDVHLILQPYNY